MGSIIHDARNARRNAVDASWIHDPSGAYWPTVTKATAPRTTTARIRIAVRMPSRYRARAPAMLKRHLVPSG